MARVMSGLGLLGLWIGLFGMKYVVISLSSQTYFAFVTVAWGYDVLAALLVTFVISMIFSAICSRYGISVYEAVVGGASREKYTRTSYEGTVSPGLFSDRVELRAKHKTTSEYDELNKLAGGIMLFDAAIFYFQVIQRSWPQLWLIG